MVQVVEDLGKLDNTLIIYISGDNGASAEGSPNGTTSEVMQFNGAEVPVAEQLKFYDVWGTRPRPTRTWRWAGLGRSTHLSSGRSRSRPTLAAPARAWRSRGRRGSRTWVASAISSTTSSTSCRRILEATGIPAPVMVDGVAQKPIEGVSLVDTCRQG